MQKLHSALLKLSKEKGRITSLSVETTEFTKGALVGVAELPLKLYFVLTLAGLGKQRYPMCKYDPKLSNELNGQKFFPTQVGGKFESQRGRVLDKLTHGASSGFIFIEPYSLQRAKWTPHLWTLGFNIETSKGETVLQAHAQFGHCKLFPLLPYEIAGVTAIIRWMQHMTGLNNASCVWAFHSITNAASRSFAIFDSLKKLPEPSAIAEIVRFEEVVREAGKLTQQPLMRYPVGAELEQFAASIFGKWHGK